ncbi:MAG: type I glutamate--ammonia ligase [Planctomycetes bacterium]|nr:type I glutamate--ammonia ligase [Planctomycetota bacterium]
MTIRNAEGARRLLRETNAEAVDLKFCDLAGRWHHLTLPAQVAGPELFARGAGFDGSSIAGFTRLEAGDLVMLPDPSTAFLDPYWEKPTVSMVCDVVEADTREPFPRDPRSVARKAEAALAATGAADLSLWGPEFEFYVFDEVRSRSGPCASGFEIVAQEPGCRHIPLAEKSGYHVLPPLDRHHDLRAAAVRDLVAAGIPVYYHHHEVGRFGQCEIEIERLPLTRAGDAVMMVKYFVRMTAAKRGMCATFMPKPLFGEAGSGMHFHQHLFKGKKPLFHDPKGYAGLSRLALSYVAGVLAHGRALAAIGSPSSNSYRRLVPGFEAPVNLFFSLANRSAAIRVPKYADAPAEKRIEFRPPDGTCNPYLAMAAMLMAGIDGIRRKLDPTALGFGPWDEDVFEWPAERRKAIVPLPASLDEALDALREDRDFLLRDGVFTEDLIDSFVRYKREKETGPVSRRPTPQEIDLYFDA